MLRGRFTPSETPEDFSGTSDAVAGAEIEWCHRRLLARIHRLTIDGLRKQIEPVGVATYWRFLAGHHGLLPEHPEIGANGLFDVITMLQGIDAPTVAWERDLLPSRVAAYQPQWLDELCLTGDVGLGSTLSDAAQC